MIESKRLVLIHDLPRECPAHFEIPGSGATLRFSGWLIAFGLSHDGEPFDGDTQLTYPHVQARIFVTTDGEYVAQIVTQTADGPSRSVAGRFRSAKKLNAFLIEHAGDRRGSAGRLAWENARRVYAPLRSVRS